MRKSVKDFGNFVRKDNYPELPEELKEYNYFLSDGETGHVIMAVPEHTLNKAEVIYKAKEEKFEILDYINIILLDIAKKSSKYAMCINIVEDTKRRLQSNANYDMSIDNMLLKLWEQVH